MRMVITGTGRSGTGWAAATLNSAGVFAGHENVFTPKTVRKYSRIEWCDYHADCSWLAVPRLPLMNVKAALIVRNPLDVVASMQHIGFGKGMHNNDHADIARQVTGMVPSLDGYLRFWLEWNQRAIPNCEAIFTLDQLLQNPMTLTRWAGAKYEPHNVGVINDRPEWKVDARPEIGWDSFTDHAAVYQAQFMWNNLSRAHV
jgi:hypothetical protein